MEKNELAVIVLAAGLGTRMKSRDAKVLCKIKGKPMLLRSVKVAVDIAGTDTFVVVGHQAENVKKIVSEVFDVKFVYQKEQIGTGHAVLCSVPFLPSKVKDVVVLCGDVPLLSAETVRDFVLYHRQNNNDISVLAIDIPNPEGYGRISFSSNGTIDNIIEEIDASDQEKENTLVNTGIFCIRQACIEMTLREVKRDNAKNEMYLPDIVKVGYANGLKLGVHISSNINELVGVNTMEELIKAEMLCNTNIVN